MTEAIRLLICDDHPILANGLAALLARDDDIAVVGVVGSVEEVIAAAERLVPDVVLMDYELPDGTGADATARVLAVVPTTRVVMLTSFTDDDVLVACIEAGAIGFVTKHSGSRDLAAAVRLAANDESVVAPDLLVRLLPRLVRGAPLGTVLTDREREILSTLAGGASNQAIATSLGLSPHTVRNHLARIYERLGARSRLEAVAIAVREGYITDR
jgi:DNA-binding NarL/FixJ family response regulator